MLVGTSAGALNAASLAADADRGAEHAAARLIERWRGLRQGNVFQSIARRQALVTTVRYAGEFFGVPGIRLRGLLDPTPLRRSLNQLLNWPAVHRNLDDGPLDCLAVAASRAANPRAMVFIEGGDGEAVSTSNPMIEYVNATLSGSHLMASAAIPMLFLPCESTNPARPRAGTTTVPHA